MQVLCRYALGKRRAQYLTRATIPSWRFYRTFIIVLLTLLLGGLQAPLHANEPSDPRNRVYRFQSDMYYPPFEYVEDGELTGFGIELLEAVAQVMELDIRFEGTVWAQARRNLESGQIDGVTGMFVSEERRYFADFGDPYVTVSYSLFAHEDSPLTTFEDALEASVAVQKNDITHDYLLSRVFAGTLFTEDTPADALRRLAAGDCDSALLQSIQGRYLIDSLRLDNIVEVRMDVIPQQRLCFAVSKDNDWLLEQLNEGLRILKATGQFDAIKARWLSVYDEEAEGPYLFYFYVGLSVAAVLILVIFAWAQLLRREVRRRTAALKKSERRYRSLVDKMPDGIAVLRDDNFLIANRAAAVLFTGDANAVLEGTSVLPYLHPEDRPVGLVHLSALPEPDAPLSDARVIRPGSHEIRHVETTGIMIDYHDGPATLVMLRDITARKQAEESARRERNLVQAIMETSPVGIITFDESGVIVFANQQSERIFRIQRAEICERTYDDPKWRITDLEDQPFDVEKLPFRQVMKTKRVVHDIRFAIERADGVRIIVAVGGAPLFDAMGEAAGAVCSVEDVTAQVEEARERERHWRRMQRQQTAIIHITRDRTLTQGDFHGAARHIAQHAAEALQVDSVGLWLLKRNAALLRCAAAWDRNARAWMEYQEIPAQTIPDYLLALETERYVDASDAQHDPRTVELCPGYIRPGNIGALLHAPIRVGGRLVGVLCADHRGMAREWLSDEIQFVVELADQAGQAYAAEERQQAEEERRLFEAKLQHTQKLESLGILAGGIAHDFNNLLMAIIGNVELALMDISHANPARKAVIEIEGVARRAADLCRQMLAYSGKGKFVVEPISLNDVITEIDHMLNVSIPKNIVLRYDLAEELPAVEADVSQMRQVLMNLVINASEAIGEKDGIITVSTGTLYCDQSYFDKTNIQEDLPDGEYVSIEVADTGEGMDTATVARIFEPFFTTKFTGRGLGLAAVLGIVRGHRGALKVYSEVNKGATFKVLFPASAEAAVAYDTNDSVDAAWRGSGTVLLVDDEEVLLAVTSKMLDRLGFKVLTASNGMDALEIFKENADDICCIILDLTMPNMNGEECFRELRRIREDVRVILSSGFNEQEATQRFVGKGLAGFVQKPYRFATLAAKLRDSLDE